MSELLNALVLSAVQAITEFFPISSSAHLHLLNSWGISVGADHTFSCLTSLGSGMALLCFFFSRLFRPFSWHLLTLIAFATLPLILIGPVLHQLTKNHLHSSTTTGISLILGGVLFFFIDARQGAKQALPSAKQAVYIALSQLLALIPGVSRSGATIATGLCTGLSRKAAVEFSFLLAIPTLLGAGVHELICKEGLEHLNATTMSVGLLGTCALSLLVIGPCLRLIERVGLFPFGCYRIVLGFLVIMY